MSGAPEEASGQGQIAVLRKDGGDRSIALRCFKAKLETFEVDSAPLEFEQ
jgi:hypothetical protein